MPYHNPDWRRQLSFIKIKTRAEENGPEIEVTLAVRSIEFAVKPLAEPWLLSLRGATFQVPEIADETKFTDAGMVLFDIKDGGRVYVKPTSVTGFFTPELGTYILVLESGKLSVKATYDEIETKLTPMEA